MTTISLVVKVLRGSGIAGVSRLLLMTAGYAIGLTVVLFLAAMPAVLDDRGRVVAAREPVYAGEGTTATFAAHPTTGLWRGERVTRVFLADVTDGAPLPPGVSVIPRAGQVVLSPAAQRLVREDAEFAALMPGTAVGVIEPTGLTGPDDLMAYVGVGELAVASPSRGWGGYDLDEEVRSQYSAVPWQLLLIAGPPVAVYFIVCARLSTSTRLRRYAALRLVGMSRRQVLKVSALESAAAGIAGCVLGIAGYQVVNSLIGPSGVLGFSWFPEVSSLSAGALLAAAALSIAMAVAVGRVGTSRALSRPTQVRGDTSDPTARWWLVAPFLFGMGLLILPLIDIGLGHDGVADPLNGGLLIAGTILSAVGMLAALRPVLVGVARAVNRDAAPVALRIAARRVEAESSTLAWHLAGLSILVLIAAIGAGVLRQTELTATPDTQRLVVKVAAQELPAPARQHSADLPASDRWLLQTSVLADEPPAGRPVTIDDRVQFEGVTRFVATCDTVRRILDDKVRDCVDGHEYRITRGGEAPIIPAGYPIPFRRADGAVSLVGAPVDTITMPRGGVFAVELGLLVTEPVQQMPVTEDSLLYYRLPPDITEVDRFATELSGLAPSAAMTVFDLDLPALEAFRVHRGVVGIGLQLAFLLAVAAFVISAVARAVERRRDITSLVAIGVSTAVLRRVQLWQTVTPLILTLAATTVIGHLTGNALLRLQGQQHGWFIGTIQASWPLALAGVAAAVLAGLIVVGTSPRAEDLRRQ